MTYDIIDDLEKIVTIFNDDAFMFSIFNTRKHDYTTNIVYISDLEQFMIENKQNKNDRRFIVFNPYTNGRKTKINALLPNKIMVDIDAKTPFQQNLLMADTQTTNISDALEKLLKSFQEDPCCLYVDTSSSGLGIKAVYTIISDAYLHYCKDFKSVIDTQTHNAAKGITDYDPNNTYMLLHMFMDSNYKLMLSYLKDKYNLVAVDKGYIDPAGGRVTQGTYSSWGKNIVVKTIPHIIFYKIKEKQIAKFAKSFKVVNTLPNDVLKKSNDEYLDKLKIYMNGLQSSGNKDDLLLYNINAAKLADDNEHYNYPILLSLNWVSAANLYFFYNILKTFYLGDSINLNTFQEFQKFIYSIKGNGIELKNLIPIYIFDEKDKGSNLFENKYDQIISFKKYISEKTSDIEEILNKYDRVVLEADAGAGKTNFYMELAANKLLNNEIRKAVIVIPKNSLLDQQYHIVTAKYPTLNIIKNYKGAQVDNDEVGLFLSSTPSINKIKNVDLLIVDEVQNLVSYAEKIKSNMPSVKKTILVSATPEKYLIYEKSYFYLKLLKENKDKQLINVLKYKDRNTIFQELIDPNRKQFIYYLNIDESKKLFTPANFSGITFLFANSKDQDDEDVKNIVKNQFLGSNHVVTTSYLTDGVNFNNSQWDDIIILEDDLLTPEEIYQISQRFRHLIGKINIILLAKPRILNNDIKLNYEWTKNLSHFYTELQKGFNAEKLLNVERYQSAKSVKPIISAKPIKPTLNVEDWDKITNILCSDVDNIEISATTSGLLSSKINKKNIPLTKIKHQILDEKSNKYNLNIDSIKKESYDNFFLSHYKNNSKIFYQTLDYYFKVNVIWFNDKNDTDMVINTQIKDIFNLYATDLSAAYVLLKNEEFIMNVEKIPNITEEHLAIIKANKGSFNKLSAKGNMILQLDGDVLKTTLQNNLYEKYINGLKDKKLGAETSVDNLFFNGDKIRWENQEKVADIIKKSTILKKHNMENDFILYFTIKDLLSYITKIGVYDSLIDVDGEYLFDLTEKSCFEYIKNINRHFKTKQITTSFTQIPNPNINIPAKNGHKRKPFVKKSIKENVFIIK